MKTNVLLNIEIVSIDIIPQKQVRHIFTVWANVIIKTDVLEWYNINFILCKKNFKVAILKYLKLW